jgi:hypothetical protein
LIPGLTATVDEGQITADPNGNGIRLLLTGSDTTTAPKGTKLSSTRYVHYGTINFELRE